MRRSEEIRKIRFGQVVPPVLKDIKKKPKLLVPFVISFLINIVITVSISIGYLLLLRNDVRWYGNFTGIEVIDEFLGVAGFYHLPSIIIFVISFMTMIIFSGWSIINYWTYVRTGDFSLSRSFRKIFKYIWKMLGASLLASLILIIPINLPEYICYLLWWDDLGQDTIQRWGYGIMMFWSIWSLVLTTIFVFIHHSIIIEKKGVFRSLKRSISVSAKNFWVVLLVRILPLFLAIPIMIMGQFLYSSEYPMYSISIAIMVIVPFLISVVIGPIVTLSMIRLFILSVFKSRKNRDKWGFKTK